MNRNLIIPAGCWKNLHVTWKHVPIDNYFHTHLLWNVHGTRIADNPHFFCYYIMLKILNTLMIIPRDRIYLDPLNYNKGILFVENLILQCVNCSKGTCFLDHVRIHYEPASFKECYDTQRKSDDMLNSNPDRKIWKIHYASGEIIYNENNSRIFCFETNANCSFLLFQLDYLEKYVRFRENGTRYIRIDEYANNHGLNQVHVAKITINNNFLSNKHYMRIQKDGYSFIVVGLKKQKLEDYRDFRNYILQNKTSGGSTGDIFHDLRVKIHLVTSDQDGLLRFGCGSYHNYVIQ